MRLIIEERWIVEEGRGLEDCGVRGEWAWGKGLGKVRSDRKRLKQWRWRRGCCASPPGMVGGWRGAKQLCLCAFLRAGAARGSHAGVGMWGWLAAQSCAAAAGEGREHLT